MKNKQQKKTQWFLEKIKNNYLKFIFLSFLAILYVVLYKIYMPRVNAFGCFDDCNNFMRGYFVLFGKDLFSQVFSGHQPFASYLSLLIQKITNPQNIYELVLRHRQFIFLFGFSFNILLLFRFGLRIVIFALIFEFSKFYLFGDRFLAETIVVYPILYLVGLCLFKISGKKIKPFDFIFSSLLAWFIIFTRAPYIPLVLLLFLVLLWEKRINKIKIISVLLFTILSLITIFYHNVKEFFFDVVIFNLHTNIPSDLVPNGMPGPRIIQSIFYPFYVLFFGKINIFRFLLMGIDIVFLILIANEIRKREYKKTLFLFLILSLANIRVVAPGEVFYGAFHLLVWYAILIFVTLDLFTNAKNKFLYFLSFVIIGISFFTFILSPYYFAREKINTHAEFITNYGVYLQVGEVTKQLSEPNDKLFVDGFNDLIYWQAKRFSSYKYSWYTSSMALFPKFRDERVYMFKNSPPDFYYGSCPKENDPNKMLPDFIKKEYVRLFENNKPSCLWVKKSKLSSITDDKWQLAKDNLYTLSKEQ